jgi:hypothetical protein
MNGQLARVTPVAAVRAFGMMLGAPVALFVGAAACAVAAIRALARGRAPGRGFEAGVLATGIYVLLVRPWMLHWGATEAERRQPLPGNEIAPRPGAPPTRAVTVEAPPEAVWPWVAQLGQDRAGFYSYEWLENLAGCEMENADRVHPEWQSWEVGETLPLHPATGVEVARFDPGEALVMDGWGAIVLERQGARTRLIARGHAPAGLLACLYPVGLEIPHVIMERRMLLGIKQRAEARVNGRHA